MAGLFPCVPLLLGLAALSLGHSIIYPKHPKLPAMLWGRPPGGFKVAAFSHYTGRSFHEEEITRVDQYPDVSENWFIQKLDHFNPLNTATWKQRYFYNKAKVDGSKNNGQDIIFLMIGGEGKENPKWVGDNDVQMVRYAEQFGAHMFDLEHRFFGPSRPINNMKTTTLKLLTTEQALADLAFFIESMNKKYFFKNPKWITFGGSYPGALSAQFRLKYPQLTYGAVASSAPINLALDFYDYGGVIQAVMDNIGTNKTCTRQTKEAFDTMQQLALSPEGRNVLNTKLKLKPAFDDKTTKRDINNFFANVFNVFQGMTQYSRDGSRNQTKYMLTVAKMCELLGQSKGGVVDPVANIWDLIVWYNQYWNTVTLSSFDNSYDDMIRPLQLTDYSDEGAAEYRGWMWLCCNELGYLQSTDTDTVFGSSVPIYYFFDMCMDMFGKEIHANYTRINNLAAQQYYGGEGYYEGSNVFFINGGYDPWHALGFFHEINETNVHFHVVHDGAHCCDMYPYYDGEPNGLPEGRALIVKFLSGLIFDVSPPPQPGTSVAPPTFPSATPVNSVTTTTATTSPTNSPTTPTTSSTSLAVLPAVAAVLTAILL